MTKTRLSFIAFLLSFLLPGSLAAQQNSKVDTSQSLAKAIAVSQVTAEVTRTNALLSDKQSLKLSFTQKASIDKTIDTLSFKLNMLREDPRIHRVASLNFRSLSNLRREWESLQFSLQEIQNELASDVAKIEDDRTELDKLLTVWNLTLTEATEIESPESVLEQIRYTELSIQNVLDSMRTTSQYLQERLVVLSNNSIICSNILEEILSASDQVSSRIFDINQEPLWHIFKSEDETLVISSERSHIDDLTAEVKEFATDNTMRVLLHALLIVLIFFAVIGLNRNIDKSIPHKNISEIATIKKIAGRPYSVSVLLGFLCTYLFYSAIPEVLILLNTIILLVPVILILYDILPQSSRRAIIVPLVSLVLIQFHSLGYSETFFSRLYLISVILLLLFILAPFILNNLPGRDAKKSINNRSLEYILLIAFILLTVALVAAVAGAVMLTEYLTYAIIKSAALILIIYALRLTLNSTIYTLLHSRTFQNLNLIAQYHIQIYKRTEKSINLLSWILWTIFTMQLFSIWDEVSAFLKRIWNSDFGGDNIDSRIGDLLLFIIILIITIWLSRLVKTIIEGEIAPRVKMKRGVPGAMSLLLRIGIIAVGFLFAASMAGFGMDKLTILLGALGVGIGFGLQNIFNNLVSGIILAFERPIQEGDIIEVGELWGTVKEIGIRASTVFTFDGAEVIVPNGNLISNELINWTLTDRNRRVEVIIGVAYGTEPDVVLGILNEISSKHEDILQEPAPLSLFTGFGDSSLDFKLLFWIASADNRFLMQSKINVAVNKALKEAGIVIPFPQRDLHIRSVDDSAKFRKE